MQLHPDTARTISTESIRVGATSAAAVIGMSLDTWIKIATLCGILLSAAYTAWKWHRDWRRGRRREADGDAS